MLRHSFLVALLVLPLMGCEGATEWPLRESLLSAHPPDEWVVRAALDAVPDGVGIVVSAEGPIESDALIELVGALDAERALMGLDSLAAVQVWREGSEVAVGACDDGLRAEGDSAPSLPVVGRPSAPVRAALGEWVATCAFEQIPAGQPLVAVSSARLPALATFWAEAGVIFVHPALESVLEREQVPMRANGEPPFAFSRASAAAGECPADLMEYCSSCVPIDAVPEGSGDGSGEGSGVEVCEPLFASNYNDCAQLNAMGVGRDEAAARYCAWLAVTNWPEINYCSPGCVIWGEPVITWEALARTVPNLFACQVESCLSQDVIPSLPSEFGTFSYCVGKVEAYCDACGFQRENPCPSLFPDSTAVADCYDLRRGELFGNGEEMYCAFQLMTEYPPGVQYCPDDRFRCIDTLQYCMNAYDRCYDPALVTYDGWQNTPSFERLADAFYGYADPATAADCQAQIERCTIGDPFPEETDFFVGVPTGGTQPIDEGDERCGE